MKQFAMQCVLKFSAKRSAPVLGRSKVQNSKRQKIAHRGHHTLLRPGTGALQKEKAGSGAGLSRSYVLGNGQ